jgi:hypothetical protein
MRLTCIPVKGTCDLFMFAAPLEGWRRAGITGRGTRQDWAGQVKRPAGEDFPPAGNIILGMDGEPPVREHP